MTEQEKQCMYCYKWIKGDLWMAVHIEQDHSDLRTLFSGRTTTDKDT